MSVLPNGDCLAWAGSLVTAGLGAEVISAAALLSIVPAMVLMVRRRHDAVFTRIAWLFWALILVSALRIMIEIWTIWWPAYRVQAFATAASAAVSLATAVAVWLMILRVRMKDRRLTAQRVGSENDPILQANRLKTEFLANMSHELRTPLSSIIGFAELLHSGAVGAESPKHQEFLGYIATSGHQLLQLINDILDISKVEAARFEFSPQPVQLTTLVREVIEILHPVISRKQLSISCSIDEAVDHVALDPARLKQVLYNFLSNGMKFSHHGGHVAIRALPHGSGHFRVEVEDNGIGIAEADLPKLFDEFQQLDASLGRQEGGAGLGLALTRRLVEAQGGSVGVQSIHGRGASFHFILNRRQGLAS